MGLHLRRALGSRVTRMTLIDPVVVNVLRDQGEEASYAEMEEQYQRFMGGLPDQTKAARVFVEHWSGKGAWESIGERARSVRRRRHDRVRQRRIRRTDAIERDRHRNILVRGDGLIPRARRIGDASVDAQLDAVQREVTA